MYQHIFNALNSDMVLIGLFLLGPLLIFARMRPDICFALGFPAIVFLGQLKDYFPVSVSAGAALFPLAAVAGNFIRGVRPRFGLSEKLMIGWGLLMILSLRYTSAPVYGCDKTILFIFLVLPVVVLAPNIITSTRSLRLVMRVIFLTLTVYVFASMLIKPQAEVGAVRASALHDMTVAAQYLGLAVAIGLIFLVLGKNNAMGKLFIVVMLPFGVLSLFISGTRGPVLALVLTAAFVYWFVHFEGFRGLLRKTPQTFVVIVLCSVIVFLGAFVLKRVLNEEVFNRFSSIEMFFSNFTDGKVLNWRDSGSRTLNCGIAIMAFSDHPVKGVGAGGYKTVLFEGARRGVNRAMLLDEGTHAYPHNVVLEAACEQGIGGLVALLCVFFLNFKMIRGLKIVYLSDPRKHFAICLCVTTYFFGLCVSMTSLDIPRMMVLWWGMGLLLAADRIYIRQFRIVTKNRGSGHAPLNSAREI